jgi:hypothetical protein
MVLERDFYALLIPPVFQSKKLQLQTARSKKRPMWPNAWNNSFPTRF